MIFPELYVPKQHPIQIIGLAGSAGGLAVFQEVLSGLPRGLPVPILVVMHMERHRPSLLAHILDRATPLSVVQAESGMLLMPGVVFVCPPDHHLGVSHAGRVRLSHKDLVHFARPAIDELFFSLADVYGAGVAAVLCTGGGVDGSAGLQAVRRAGGTTLVQDPETAAHGAMPREAIRRGAASVVLQVAQIAAHLEALVSPPFLPVAA